MRKNKTKQAIAWPTSMYFTIQDLVKLNPKMLTASRSDITLRVRLTNAIEDGKVAEVGSVSGGKGRPQKIFAITPVTQTVLNKIRADGLNVADGADKLVNVISVATPVNTTPVISLSTAATTMSR